MREAQDPTRWTDEAPASELRFSWIGYRFALVLLAVAVSGRGALVHAQGQDALQSNVPTAARALITSIHSYPPGSAIPQLGAGIIVGADGDKVYVATALHVVRGADRIWLRIEALDGDSVVASVYRESPDIAELDLAVVTVDRASISAHIQALAFDRLGNLNDLRSNSRVSPVGCPDGICWGAPSPPDRVLASSALEVMFQSTFVKRGSSGGALFNDLWEVVGLVTDSDPPRARAIPMDQVLAQLRGWQVPVSLRKPRVPRHGYRTTVGFTVLAPTSTMDDPFYRDRVPSGRLTITRRLRPGLHAHLALLRLAPKGVGNACPPEVGVLDTSNDGASIPAPCEALVAAAMGGIGTQLKAGRFLARPFVEAGLGRSEGAFDAGGYFVEGTPDYVPNFESAARTSVGVGLGVAFGAIVFPRGILQALFGVWRFSNPFKELEGFPPGNAWDATVPKVHLGAGFEVGF